MRQAEAETTRPAGDACGVTHALIAGLPVPLGRALARELARLGAAATMAVCADAATLAPGQGFDCALVRDDDDCDAAADAFLPQVPPGRVGLFVLLVPTGADARVPPSRPGLAARVRALARRLAPRVRVNAIVAGRDPTDVAAALRLLVAAPSITGQLVGLDGTPGVDREAHADAMTPPDPTPSGSPGRAARGCEGAQGLRRVFVRDLVLNCRIGVYRHEREGAQRVRINVDLLVDESAEALSDRLGDVVCYDRIVADIRSVALAGHMNLVETLAERVAAVCLGDARVVSARVRIEKLDIYEDAGGAGVEIERRNVKR